VIPAFNESGCLPELVSRLAQVFDREPNNDFEVVIVENGSIDDSWQILTEAADNDPRFKAVRLSRNFRMDGGLTAGLSFIRGDACVLMTADLQDPPEVIPEFLRLWEQGYENVYAIITTREGTGPVRRMNSRAFYWVASRLTDNRMPKNASDFRLVDRKVYQGLLAMKERNRFVRGLVAWEGFRSVGVEIARPPRFAGKSQAYTGQVLELAVRGILAHSVKPLRMISVFGISVSLLSLVAIGLLAIRWVVYGVPFAGFGTLVSVNLLVFGLLALMLGIMSEYIGLIYEEVKARPNFLVSATVGLPPYNNAESQHDHFDAA
jgi:dolichol-phosphate mannosyltransferase